MVVTDDTLLMSRFPPGWKVTAAGFMALGPMHR
ncbi:hypothetical protein STVIR_0454 [Streptomyces viridochromogenes Tue57]|uniref:Uncharacterized protein n=1 Tax=Streptomyces viridochromogenes Tue57 TaxID=1160705 RepID=L8PRB7_STRVR|nr:hypothetical protein STVIR_0454 [Streptomyces viridochromogenes Tue57]